jgi:hypothetical protein
MQCYFPDYTAARLNHNFRCIKFRLLCDSHGMNSQRLWVELLCPNMTTGIDLRNEYNDDYPDPQNDMMISWKLYRAIFKNVQFNSDFNGICKNARLGKDISCVQFLGLGENNVAIIGLPTWLFVYETNEGMDKFLTSLESLLSECRVLHPDLFESHIFLLQTPMASDSGFNPKSGTGTSGWRGIQNYRVEAFSDEAVRRLAPNVDGVLPVFDLSLSWLDGAATLGWT